MNILLSSIVPLNFKVKFSFTEISLKFSNVHSFFIVVNIHNIKFATLTIFKRHKAHSPCAVTIAAFNQHCCLLPKLKLCPQLTLTLPCLARGPGNHHSTFCLWTGFLWTPQVSRLPQNLSSYDSLISLWKMSSSFIYVVAYAELPSFCCWTSYHCLHIHIWLFCSSMGGPWGASTI